jgi:hypothetical protein
MAAYALAFVITLRASRTTLPPNTRIKLWIALTLIAIASASILQSLAPPESPAFKAAEITRYYWFLSQWQWFELLGLAGPPAMLALLLKYRSKHLSATATTLCQACIVLAAIATLIAVIFSHESYATHLVARLQVLRIYLLLYAIMAMLLGATLFQLCKKSLRFLPTLTIVSMALIMAYVQRQTYTTSPKIEFPNHDASNPNPWVQAFLWSKANTPSNALFALDAKYVNTDGEDAQTFRATSLRSSLPDYSKDGGEASITPSLANQWQQAATAQKDLSLQPDAIRDANLRPFAVTWMVLHSTASTTHPCPYNNGTVKVCRLTP